MRPLDRLTAWDSADSDGSAVRRQALGRLLGADLRRATHPVLILWQLLTRGEPIRAADLPLRPDTIEAGIDAGLFDGFDVDGERFLRATACIDNATLPSGERVWVACDLPWTAGPAHVPGPGNASRTLIDALAVTRAGTAADIGTGCGVVALHLSTIADTVVATDLNPRALAFAELTATLNGRTWDLRQGSFLDPIGSLAVDLIVANPPFVLGTPDGSAVFRDGTPDLAVRLAGDVGAALPPGGTAQFLGNWPYLDGSDPMQPIVDAAGRADCLVIERAAVDLPSYVDLWVDRDDPQHERWVANLAATGAYAIGTGVVTVRRRANGTARRTGVARLHEQSDETLGPAIADWLADPA
jgi:hypothetical protein